MARSRPRRPGSSDGGFYDQGAVIMEHNSGVHISGGNVSGPVAAGPNAHAVQVNQGSADLLGRLDAALAELSGGLRELPPERAAEAGEDIELFRTEIGRERPSGDRLRRILARLAVTVGSAAALLAKVDQIKDLVTTLIR